MIYSFSPEMVFSRTESENTPSIDQLKYALKFLSYELADLGAKISTITSQSREKFNTLDVEQKNYVLNNALLYCSTVSHVEGRTELIQCSHALIKEFLRRKAWSVPNMFMQSLLPGELVEVVDHYDRVIFANIERLKWLDDDLLSLFLTPHSRQFYASRADRFELNCEIHEILDRTPKFQPFDIHSKTWKPDFDKVDRRVQYRYAAPLRDGEGQVKAIIFSYRIHQH